MDRVKDLLQRSIWIAPLIGLIAGLALGLLIGWVIAPVSYQLNADDVAAIADSYAANKDLTLARARLTPLSKDDQTRLLSELVRERTANKKPPEELERIHALAQAVGVTIRPASTAATPAATRAPTTGASPSAGFNLGSLLPILAITAIAGAILIAGILLVPRLLPELRARRATRAPAAAQPASASAAAKSFAAAPPRAGGLGRYVAAYALGTDNFDTSFSLETPRQEFLGECGMGVSETIGEGKPDKIAAFDVWLFDKGDVRTVTLVLMSEYAFNDPTLHGKLASKGDAVLAEKGKTLRLETQSLAVDAQIVELVYASNPNVAVNSHFQKLTVEMVPVLKTGGA